MVQRSLALLAAAVSRAAPRLRKAPLVLTDAAADRIRELLDKRNKVPVPDDVSLAWVRSLRSAHPSQQARLPSCRSTSNWASNNGDATASHTH